MFDIDGTLTESNDVDSTCFASAVRDVTGISINTNWSMYRHVTDSGILNEFIEANGLENKEKIKNDIKSCFLKYLETAIAVQPIREIPGASGFISELSQYENVVISLATGGWLESALLKLKSAEIAVGNIPIASSNDHFARTEIMKIARNIASGEETIQCTYFGDGAWDKKACELLGFNFIAVGGKVTNNRAIVNYHFSENILRVIGL